MPLNDREIIDHDECKKFTLEPETPPVLDA